MRAACPTLALVTDPRFTVPLTDLEQHARVPVAEQQELQAELRANEGVWQPVPPADGAGAGEADGD